MRGISGRHACLALVLVGTAAAPERGATAAAPDPAPFALRSGDRVVLLGGGFAEALAESGDLETMLHARAPGASIKFRDASRSGDTLVEAIRPPRVPSRDAQLAMFPPTVAILALGPNEAFAGAAGIETFRASAAGWIDRLSGSGARVVLVAPPVRPGADDRSPADPASRRATYRLYRETIAALAAERGAHHVDLDPGFADIERNFPSRALTEDGARPTPLGTWWAAVGIEHGLGLEPPRWRVTIDLERGTAAAAGTTLDAIARPATGPTFRATDDRLPWPSPPATPPPDGWSDRTLRVVGLAQGRHELLVDGAVRASGTAAEWARGLAIDSGPEHDQADTLRDAVRAKNQLVRDRHWSPPSSSTDPAAAARDAAIVAAETRIRDLTRPRPHVYALRPAAAGDAGSTTRP